MKRMVLMALAAFALAAVPFAGLANDIPDGAACDGGAAGAYPGTDPDNLDRGAYCVNGGGFTVFYLGGEAQPEEAENQDGTAGLCGSLTILGQTYGSGHSGGTGPGGAGDWNWVHMHPGPDGILGTEDDVPHEHDCQ